MIARKSPGGFCVAQGAPIGKTTFGAPDEHYQGCKWQHQPALRRKSWQRTIAVQRKDIAYELRQTPSLKTTLEDAEWLDLVWSKAVVAAASETGLDTFPETCPWPMSEVLSQEFYPE